MIHPCTHLRTAIFYQKHISFSDSPWLPCWSLILQYVKDKFESRLMIRPIRWNFPKSHTFLSKAALVYQSDFHLVFVSHIICYDYQKEGKLTVYGKGWPENFSRAIPYRVTRLTSLSPFFFQHYPHNFATSRLIYLVCFQQNVNLLNTKIDMLGMFLAICWN